MLAGARCSTGNLMSQDKPNSQPPLSPEPNAGKSDTTALKKTQTFGQTRNRVQTVLKTQSITALRGTIQVLEGVLVRLEAENTAGTLPPDATGETPSLLEKLQLGWSGVLAKIRSLLPGLSSLSNTALTGILAGIAIIVVWTTSTLLPGKPAEVAVPPPEPVASSEPVPSPNITTPPELTAPAAPQPIEVIPSPPVPTPTPTVELTPEQTLIAGIENQVTEITDHYANGLIQSIQANFQASRLTIKVSDNWYKLKQSQQNKLVAQTLERSKELDFTHLEITDPQGTLLARSPVVGNDMVILKRQVLGDQESARGLKSE